MTEPVKAVMNAMMDKLVARLSPEDIQGMMREMMGQVLSGLDLTEKTTFMQAMMDACIPRLTEGLTAAEREQLATSIASQMALRLREAGPTAPGAVRAPGGATIAGAAQDTQEGM